MVQRWVIISFTVPFIVDSHLISWNLWFGIVTFNPSKSWLSWLDVTLIWRLDFWFISNHNQVCSHKKWDFFFTLCSFASGSVQVPWWVSFISSKRCGLGEARLQILHLCEKCWSLRGIHSQGLLVTLRKQVSITCENLNVINLMLSSHGHIKYIWGKGNMNLWNSCYVLVTPNISHYSKFLK